MLINTAQRLSNVAHSLIEKREKEYLDDNEYTAGISENIVDSTIKLCSEARENIKLALYIKKERTNSVLEVMKVLKN